MPRVLSASLLLAIAPLAAASFLAPGIVSNQSESSQGEAPWRELFDGRSMAGWSGPEGLFRIENGVLVGSTQEQRIPANRFLVFTGRGETSKEYERFWDFELRVEMRVLGSNNSGIQYRARLADPKNSVLHGYQCDIHPNGPYCGMLYDEGGRGIVCQRGERCTIAANGSSKKEKAFDSDSQIALDEWHEYRIVAKGNRLRHFVDGNATVDITDGFRGRLQSGLIGLQLHSGAPMRIEVRRVRIREFGKTLDEGTTPVPEWIWLDAAKNDDVVYFRKAFEADGESDVDLTIACDNASEVYLDGKKTVSTRDWAEPARHDFGKLAAGLHVLSVRASNEGGPAGLIAAIAMRKKGMRPVIVASDPTWKATREAPEGWLGIDFDDTQWSTPLSLAMLGGGVWGDAVTAAFDFDRPSEVVADSRPADDLRVPSGFVAERLVTIPKSFGSWVAFASAGAGTFYASDQRAGLYRIDVVHGASGRTTTVRREPVDIGGAQGLCKMGATLYAFVNSKKSGLYAVTDSDGDDRLDRAEVLLELLGSGEHGVHAIVPSPDGKGLYLVCGNHTQMPEVTSSRVPQCFDEDRLPPAILDPNGHANGIRAPGGFVLRVDLDGKNPELIATGFRNTYDVAIDSRGEMFTYDADMEWDFGMPWYRPTRILHVVPGADFGWRTGSGKWSEFAEDSLPPAREIGPGSPTAVVFGTDARFPSEWRRRMYAFDWTFGTIWAVDFTPNGGSFSATSQVFATGKPMPFTDAVIGGDGAMYCITGGRGTESRVYRISHPDSERASDGAKPSVEDEAALHGGSEPVDVETAWSLLGESDRFRRHAARTAIERTDFESWHERAMTIDADREPLAAAVMTVAFARHMSRKDRDTLFTRLAALPFDTMQEAARLAVLRAAEIALARHGKPRPSIARSFLARLEPHFPNKNEHVDAELARILCGLGSEAAVAGCLAKLAEREDHAPPAWTDVLERNDSYGKPIRRMLEDPPPTAALHYVNCLRMVDRGMGPATCERVLSFLQRARRKAGGASYKGFIDRMRDAFVDKLEPSQRGRIASLLANWEAKEERFTPPRGPGRTWTVDTAMSELEPVIAAGTLREASYREGRNLYWSVGCARCHHYDGEGGGVGPDLSSVGTKYSVRELLESMIEPDKVIADQYVAQRIRLRSGKVVLGQIATGSQDNKKRPDHVTVWPASADSKPIEIARSDIESIEAAATSPMPPSLLDSMSKDELVQLLAFLLGDAKR
ncbi:MAG: DUF1080 domain-containing protein [Planctomycetes bacterium]|nr:DUF1080 domain-containing protein [Planctomycetota bacterium]